MSILVYAIILWLALLPSTLHSLCVERSYTIPVEYTAPYRAGHDLVYASLRVGLPPAAQMTGLTPGAVIQDKPGYSGGRWLDPPHTITYTLQISPAHPFEATTWTGFTATYDDGMAWGRLAVDRWRVSHCYLFPIVY